MNDAQRAAVMRAAWEIMAGAISDGNVDRKAMSQAYDQMVELFNDDGGWAELLREVRRTVIKWRDGDIDDAELIQRLFNDDTMRPEGPHGRNTSLGTGPPTP